MRVLHYNWVDPDDPAGRGGGVRVYMQALVAAQRAQPGWQVTTLAAGLAHDLRAQAPRWHKIRAGHYEIVNSATLAPSQADFATQAQISDPPTEAAFADFIARTGPYDVIHFHSLEGLPAQVLALGAAFGGARLILSLHNYHPFCPQVNLWVNEAAHCSDFEGGRRCATCLPALPNPGAVRQVYRAETALGRLGMGPGTALYRRLWRPALQSGWRMLKRWRGRRGRAQALPSSVPPPVPPIGPPLDRRARITALINAHCDAVLAVSERTAALAQGFGLAKVTPCYIGSEQAVQWRRTTPRALPQGISPARPLRLAYLGYMRRDKGFAFLLDALEALPPPLVHCLHLTVAARRGEEAMVTRLMALRARLAGLDWHDGYSHATLDALLAQVECGIVPPLWEDNLPQVALEMHARHIPLLTSDRGGAQELGGSAALRFRAGDVGDFAAVLARLVAGEVSVAQYWAQARVPADPAEHAAALAQIYEGCR